MNYLAAILITFTIGFTQNVSAEWLGIYEIEGGGIVYIETDTIKKADGFIYFWDMHDYVVPLSGYLSSQTYYKADCKRSRVKTLRYIFYSRNMGRGQAEQQDSVNKDWKYPSPGTGMNDSLNSACKFRE